MYTSLDTTRRAEFDFGARDPAASGSLSRIMRGQYAIQLRLFRDMLLALICIVYLT